MERLKALLTEDLLREGARIAADAPRSRILDLARVAPFVVASLAEPWTPADEAATAIALRCGRLHLYARVLDDALDIGGAGYGETLLRAQALLWESVWELAARAPALGEAAAGLIRETVAAVVACDRRDDPALWGRKNAHLLLSPLFLGGEEFAGRHKADLLAAIALLQAREEWIQAENPGAAPFAAIAARAAESAPALAEAGFEHLAAKTLAECRALLNAAERQALAPRLHRNL